MAREPTIDFAAVYASPGEDGPRLVLADALLEQGDERGEFLSLQLRAKKTPAQVKRAKALLEANGARWLAPFGPTLGAGVKWSRGFPSQGRVKFRDGAAVKKYGALPEWATFESLTWSPAKSEEHRAAAGFIGPAFRHLLRADGPSIRHLLEGAWALTWLRGEVASPDELVALLAHSGLRHLETLHLTCHQLEVEWISSVKNWGPLEELGVPDRSRPWLIHLLAAAQKTPLLRFQWGEGLRFHRETDGALTRLELLDHSKLYSIASQLESLPEGLVTSLVAPPSAGWATGYLGTKLERVIKGSPVRPSIAKAAARHLDLGQARSIALSGDDVLVSDVSTVRAVDSRSFEVVASFPERGGWLDPLGRDVLRLRGREQVVLYEFSSSTERVLLEGKSLSTLTRSADGTRAAIEENGKVLVLDVATGRVVFTCDGAEPVLDPKGERMTVRSGGGCVLHDLRQHTHQTLEGVRGRTSFLPDGRLANRDGPVVMWRKPGDAFSLSTAGDPDWSLLGTADGSRLVLVQPSLTQVFDGRNARVLHQLPGGDCGLLLPDGRLFIASGAALTCVQL